MKIIVTVLIHVSILMYASDDFVTLIKYENTSSPHTFNFILFVNELNISIEDQNILNRVLKKSDFQMIDQGYGVVTKELFNKGYQLVFVTYMNKNELIGPLFNHHHLYLKYSIRKDQYRLNRERKIIANAFNVLDEFVSKEVHRRPLCIVFQLPPKQLYQLEKKHSNNNTSYEFRRDFALVNLYHEIHRRRYMYPNKLLVYPSLTSKTGVLVNNK